MGVDKQVEPISRLFDRRAAFQPDSPGETGLGHCTRDRVGDPCQVRVAGAAAHGEGLVCEIVLSGLLAILGITGGRQGPDELEFRFSVQQVDLTVLVAAGNATVDVREHPGSIGIEGLPAAIPDGWVGHVFGFEGDSGPGPILAAGHVGQQVRAVFREELHFVVLLSVVPIDFPAVFFHGMAAEFLDPDGDWLIQRLGHQMVEPSRQVSVSAVAALVAGDQ